MGGALKPPPMHLVHGVCGWDGEPFLEVKANCVAPHMLLYLSTANGVGSRQFRMEAVPSTFQKPVSGDLA